MISSHVLGRNNIVGEDYSNFCILKGQEAYINGDGRKNYFLSLSYNELF